MAYPVMWFEVIGKDPTGLQKFYRETFGWKMTPPVKEMGNYSMLERPERGIGGGIGEGDARISVYMECSDPQSVVDKAVASGARLLMPLTQITPTTTIAMLMDPAGNTFGVMKAPSTQQKTTRRATAAKTTQRKKTTTSARRKSTASRGRASKSTSRGTRRSR